ncbi:MAG: hypothetical protein DRJ47_09360 [Thermoprotei archaeon]|nr:MAG: hypothetical protein DRJ47_09360 [Thermoprotei archaeon]
MRLLRKLRKIFGRSPFEDQILFKDNLVITMRDENGKIVKQWEERGNTWVTYGKEQIRDALCDGGFSKISYMYCYATTNASEQSTTNSKPNEYTAQFVATWPASPEITGINKFSIRQVSGGNDLAQISVSSFDKPDGISLEVTWKTIIS